MIKNLLGEISIIGTQKAADSRLQILLEFAGGCPPPSIDKPKGLYVELYKINS
jgi:hypothetical protein